MIQKEEANEKIQKGWLRAWLMFEVLAVNSKAAKEALEELIEKLDKDERAKLYKREFTDIQKVDKPLENIEVGYSQTCEIEFITKNLDSLVQIVTEYGPSAAELLEPSELKLRPGEAQAILNTISSMMHQFASAGIGGIVFVRGEK